MKRFFIIPATVVAVMAVAAKFVELTPNFIPVY